MNDPVFFDLANSKLSLPKDQQEKVFNQPMCDIDGSFLGFIDAYYALSLVIPKEWTIIDLGCGYNPQCFYFENHKEYIAIDVFSDRIRFQSDNCRLFNKSIENFIREDLEQFNLNTCFAILNYVPPWYGDNNKMVRDNFKNLFIYYPA